MAKKNTTLGREVGELLKVLNLETPMFDGPEDPQIVEACFHTIMSDGLGLNMDDDSLRDTPKRVATMFCDEIFYGLNYDNFPECTTVENRMGYDEVVVCKATLKSVCEHHFVPFIGVAHIGYIPNRKVLGLSKVNRVVDFFSRRPQIQERLGEQISACLRHILETQDVAVVLKAKHFCVHLRGVQDSQSETTTSKLAGRFRDTPELRAEFLALTRT